MKIIAPKNDIFKKCLAEVAYKVVDEGEEETVYEGIVAIRVLPSDLKMSVGEFRRFCQNVKVEGGRKRVKGTVLEIDPLRTKILKVRLSDDEIADLRKCAEMRDITVGELFRGTLISALAKRRRLW